ncbi:DMT family transporter [Bartonella sp. DGB2]|uniref:DMT family transporter n=1 Tax=Bartonella sp. DGB2 TaxID=3388426 RepID=UPI00398FFA21
MVDEIKTGQEVNKSWALSRHEWALCAITAIWGVTFLIVHQAMLYSGPLFFVGLRFFLAAFLCALIFWRHLCALTLYECWAGMVIGASIFVGYGAQTAGLQSVTSSQSAFITALYVPIVPILQWFFLKKRPSVTSWIGVFLAFIGLLFISGQGLGAIYFSEGEIWTLIGAVGVAFEIILISLFSAKVDSRRVTIMQLFFGGLFSLIAMPFSGEAVPEFSWVWVWAAFSMACISALIQMIVNWAQQYVSPTRATIIYAGEPVWAGVAGRVAGERLGPLALLGAFFILLGILVAELRPSQWATRKQAMEVE